MWKPNSGRLVATLLLTLGVLLAGSGSFCGTGRACRADGWVRRSRRCPSRGW